MEVLGSSKSPEAEKKRHTQTQTHRERGENLCTGRSTRIRVPIAGQQPYLKHSPLCGLGQVTALSGPVFSTEERGKRQKCEALRILTGCAPLTRGVQDLAQSGSMPR